MRKTLSLIVVFLLAVAVLGLEAFGNSKGLIRIRAISSSMQIVKAQGTEVSVKEAAEKESAGEAETAKEAEGEAKEGEGEGEGHEGPPPAMYFIQWLVLLTSFGLSLAYVRKVCAKGKPHHEGLKLAYALTVLVLVYFGLNYYPTLVEFHEPGMASFVKFLLLLTTGALVTFYGVLGRHEEH